MNHVINLTIKSHVHALHVTDQHIYNKQIISRKKKKVMWNNKNQVKNELFVFK